MADIRIQIGNRPRRRRRRRALGAAGLIAALVAAVFAYSRRPGTSTSPLPSASAALTRLGAFAPGLRQIPATVVDQGPLRHVPYLSYRAGDVEVNAYGDPDRPACLEIGVFGDAARRPAARDALAGLLGADLSALDLAKDKKTRDGLTLEVTPETAADAYGGWWISVYDLKALDAARASEGELKELSVPRPADAKARRPGKSIYVPSFRRLKGIYSRG